MRKGIHQPVEYWEVFEKAAERAGISLSQWIANCCLAKIPPKVKANLPDRPSRGDALQQHQKAPSEKKAPASNRRPLKPHKAPYVLDDMPRYKEPIQAGWKDYGYNEHEPFGISAKECRILDSVKSIDVWEYTAGQRQHVIRLASKYQSLPQWVRTAADILTES